MIKFSAASILISVLALSVAASMTACSVDQFLTLNNDSAGSESAVVSETAKSGNTDPDKAKSIREYIELTYGPVTDDYDELVSSDGGVYVIAEDKEYGFMYYVRKAADVPYSECQTNFPKMFKGYIHGEEEENIDSLVDGFNDKVELNFLESEFILAEFTLTDTSKAPELTEKMSEIFKKYDDRNFFEEYLFTAKDTNGDIIGYYVIGEGYTSEK